MPKKSTKITTFCANLKLETDQINKFLERIKRPIDERELFFFTRGKKRRYIHLQVLRKLRHASPEHRKELEKEFEKLIFEEKRKFNLGIKRKLKNRSNNIQKLLDEFERKQNVPLNIVISLIIYLCPKCKGIICTERFHTCICRYCGQKVSSISRTDSIPVHMLNGNTLTFIDKAMWLEYGIDYLLRRKNFQTLCGVYILGHSGVEHEIDNLGDSIKENIRIFCECKSRDIEVRDILIFAGKMLDIGCSRGYFFTTSFGTSREIRQLARSRNITIIEYVLEKNESDILREIKEE